MKKSIIALIMAVGMFSTCTPYSAYAKNKSDAESDMMQVLYEFESLDSDSFFSDVDLDEGKVFVSGVLSSDSINNDEEVFDFIDENESLFDLDSMVDNLEIIDEKNDELGFKHIELQQFIDNIPIENKIVTIHCDEDGQVVNITADVENDIDSLTKLDDSEITTDQAVKIAENEFNYYELAYEPPVETIAYVKDGKAYKTYKVNIKFHEPEVTNCDVYVEAYSGKILDKKDKIRYDYSLKGTGKALDGKNKYLNMYFTNNKYYLMDVERPGNGNAIGTFTANNRQSEQGYLVNNRNNNFNSQSLSTAVSAHYYAGVVYDFYKNLFGRNSIDDKGMSLMSTVNYGKNYNNAFWDGSEMFYGDGDGRTFSAFCGDLDVVGHEMTHGVTEHTANLNYQGQSGALNESMSDVMGVLIQTYDKYNVKNGGNWKFNPKDWVVGDDIYTPRIPGDALRSLAEPTKYNQPGHMNNYYNTKEDNGGVHINSGIPNKAAYLVAKSIGNEKTARIYYRALVNYMNSTTNFSRAKNALVQAATDLYGANGNEVNAVRNAFNAVGIK